MNNRHRNLCGHRVARLRRALGMTQAELAQRVTALNVPMSERTIGRVERRTRKLYDAEAYALAEAFDRTVAELLGERSRI